MNEFLKSKRLYMLFVLPFLILAVAFISSYFTFTPVQSVQVQGVINIAYLNQLDKFWISLFGSVTVLALAYLMFFINERYKLLSQTTTLPSLIYVLLTSGIIINLGFDYLLVSVLIIAFALERLQAAISNNKSNSPIFDFGCLIMLAVAIYPKFVLLVLWAICVLLFSGRSTLKDIMAVLMGLITPVLFITFYYFWTDRLDSLSGIFRYNLMVGEHIGALPMIEWVRLGLLLFLLLVAFSNIVNNYSISVVSQRRGILSVVSLLLFLTLTLFIIPGNYYDFMYVISFPLAFIYAQYFLSSRWIVFTNAMFFLLLFACFLTFLI